ncbi:MAG: biopolymer transporter ExbD [Ferruginibacter sp.]
MAEITTSTLNNKKGSFARKTNHRSTKVDLTPMVDLGFLLITFFVFTTAMSQPMAMNMIEPKDGIPIPVKQSGAMTILLSKNHQVYYYYGMLSDKLGPGQIRKTDFSDARKLIANKKKLTDIADLMYIIKADEDATFGDNIDLLDEMTICNIPGGHYTEVDITKAETDLVKLIE